MAFREIGYLPSDIGVYSPPDLRGTEAIEAGIESAREDLLALGLTEDQVMDHGANRDWVRDAATFGWTLDHSWRKSIMRWGTEEQKSDFAGLEKEEE